MARLEAYAGLLRQWSARINLVGAKTLDDLWQRHFLDSAQLLPLLEGAQTLLDIGSGAGFPGLVMAILGVPSVELAESDVRKCAFLREAARLTETRLTIHNTRIESLPPHSMDAVTARACAPLDRLLLWSQPFIGDETRCLFPKGEQAGQEVSAAKRIWEFEVSEHPSRADPRGVILCLTRVRRREKRAEGP